MAQLADALVPALPATAVAAAVAADDGGYAVKLSDDCPLDGRFEVGSITKTFTGVVLASLAGDGVLALDDKIGRWVEAGHNGDITLGWALGPPGYLGHEGGTSGFQAMLGINLPAFHAAGVLASDRAARRLPLAVRRSLRSESGTA